MVNTSQLTSASDNSFLSAFKSSASNSSGYKSAAINPIETNKTANPFGDKTDFTNSDLFKQFGSGNTNLGELGRNNFDSFDKQEQEKLIQHKKFLEAQEQQRIVFSNIKVEDDKRIKAIIGELKNAADQTLITHNKELHATLHVKKSETLENKGSVGFITYIEALIRNTYKRIQLLHSAEKWAQELKSKKSKRKAKEAGGVSKGGIHQMLKGDSAEVGRAIFADMHPDRGSNAGQ